MERKFIVLLIIISLIGTAVLPVNGLKSKKENETIQISEIENFIDFFSDDYDINKKNIFPLDCEPICIIPDSLGDTTTEALTGNLQDTLNTYPYYDLSSIDVINNQTQYQLWDYDENIADVTLEFEFIDNTAGNQNVVGYYFDSDETSFVGVFEIPDNSGNNHSGYDLPTASVGDKFIVNNIPKSDLGKIGFAIDSESGTTSYKVFSENNLNSNNIDRALVFNLCDDVYDMIYVICFEDLITGSDDDYDDAVFILRVLGCESCNEPPIISDEDPLDGSSGISIGTSELSVYIEDPDEDNFDWTIQTSPDIGSSSGNDESDGLKTCYVSDLAYDTTYTWIVTASDTGGSGEITEATYTFTTGISTPPEISNPDPFDEAVEVDIDLEEISVIIQDPEGDTFDWTIDTDPDIGSASGSNNQNGTKTCVVSGLEYDTNYTWTVSAIDLDGSGQTTEKTFSFSTISSNPPNILNPNPDDGLSGVTISLSELNVTIQDPENDTFFWSIQTSPDIGSSYGNDENNGIKTCSISGLEYETTYYWYVNATDSGSGETTQEIFSFTTETESNDWPTILNPIPYTGATWVPISISELSVTIIDPEYDRFNWSIETVPDIGNSSGTMEHDGVKTCSVSGLEYDKTYKWIIEANDPTGSGRTRRRYYLFKTEPVPPNPPVTPEGPSDLDIGKVGRFCTTTSHPEGLKVQYRFDWDSSGSHDYSYWTNFVTPGTEICLEHSWNKPGVYVVKSMARDEIGASSSWSVGMTIIIGNHPPDKPETPLKKTRPQISATFSTKTTDPDGDNVFYLWDWGDGTTSNWLGPYESNETVTISHDWAEEGNFKVKVQAKDIYDFESEWSDSTQVRLLKSRVVHGYYMNMLERFIFVLQFIKLLIN